MRWISPLVLVLSLPLACSEEEPATGSCQLPALAQPGRDCSAENAICAAGFYCDGNNCIEGSVVGEACARDEQCAEGYCGSANLCVAGLATNQPCTARRRVRVRPVLPLLCHRAGVHGSRAALPHGAAV